MAKEKKLSLRARSNIPEDPDTASPERDLCQQCGLFNYTRNPFLNPPPSAGWTGKLMLLGEGPGAEEERTGRFFVGRAGQLLQRFLHSAKLLVGSGGAATDETIWNTVRCRPKNNAAPSMEQIRCCRPFFLHKLDTLNPKVLLVLGASAAKCVTNDGSASVVSLRGRPLEVNRG